MTDGQGKALMEPTWDASMETGDPAIDRQHREIIGLVDSLRSAEEGSGTSVYDVLGRLMDFTVAHFGMEEDLMQRVGYPPEPTQEMIVQHAEFTAYARLRVIEFRQGDSGSIAPLQAFLRRWLVEHEFGLDRRLVRWIREQGLRTGG